MGQARTIVAVSRRGVEDDAKREAGGSEPAGSRTLRRTVPLSGCRAGTGDTSLPRLQ